MQKISTCLWFDTQAEEAANLYVSIFKNSKIGTITRYNAESAEVSGQPEGSVLTVSFELEGMEFLALNGGSQFKFSEATSHVVSCETQEEIDHYWNSLTADGGMEWQCGWLKDKFGVTWQITPRLLSESMSSSDPKLVSRVTHVMMQMQKIDLAAIQAAVDATD